MSIIKVMFGGSKYDQKINNMQYQYNTDTIYLEYFVKFDHDFNFITTLTWL